MSGTIHIWLVTGARKLPVGRLAREVDVIVGGALGAALSAVQQRDQVMLFHGAATLVDTSGRIWADGTLGRVTPRAYPAPWDVFRALGRLKAAGPVRNEEMLQAALVYKRDAGAGLRCFAFPSDESRGTWDMVKRCKREGVEVLVTKL